MDVCESVLIRLDLSSEVDDEVDDDGFLSLAMSDPGGSFKASLRENEVEDELFEDELFKDLRTCSSSSLMIGRDKICRNVSSESE